MVMVSLDWLEIVNDESPNKAYTIVSYQETENI